MSHAAATPPLYREQTDRLTTFSQIDDAVAELSEAAERLQRMPLSRLAELALQCLDGVMANARDWERAACAAKGLQPGTSVGSEEVANGILATIRYLRLMVQSLRDIDQHGVPQLPGAVTTRPDGRLSVQVFPTRGIFDSIAFKGFEAHTWMQPGVTRENLAQHMAAYYREGRVDKGLAVVLGAGNVSSITSTDALGKIFSDGRTVLLKMNPVNEYLGPIFESAFSALIEEGFLRIIYGGVDVGSYAVQHDLTDEIHVTGSVYAFETIVWGPPGDERDRRKQAGEAVLTKPITAELGNVTPWIMVPGPYTEKQLRFQASNFASTIINNMSFNCVATKVLVTSRGWPQREQFLDLVQDVFDRVPPRKAYYPGAQDRFRRFTDQDVSDAPPGTLPWTLIRDVDPDVQPRYCEEESFVCVCAEMTLEVDDSAEFLRAATAFCNQRLLGTLGCSITVHPSFRKVPQQEAVFQECLEQLRYGTIGINYWSGISSGVMSTPWGGYPGGTLADPQSGFGWAHNTYMFDRPEKTIFEGPLTVFPQPLWFESTRHADEVCWNVVNLYHRPSLWKIPALLISALKG